MAFRLNEVRATEKKSTWNAFSLTANMYTFQNLIQLLDSSLKWKNYANEEKKNSDNICNGQWAFLIWRCQAFIPAFDKHAKRSTKKLLLFFSSTFHPLTLFDLLRVFFSLHAKPTLAVCSRIYLKIVNISTEMVEHRK